MLSKSFATRFLLFWMLASFAASASAQSCTPIENWLAANAAELGGRAVLLVYKDGKVICHQTVNKMSRRQRAAGRFMNRMQSDAATGTDFTDSTRLPIASCSKWLSAALVMTFVDEGKLRLTDTVGKWLPALTAKGKGGITVGDCLAHLTGIETPPLRESIAGNRKVGTMNEAIEKIAALPVEGPPGTVFRYGNTGLQIAGAVLEKLSGKSFETIFAERLAGPLQLKNTDFGKGPVSQPAGGAFSTARDYLNFLVMILNRGMYNGRRILSEKSIREMQVNRLTDVVKIAHTPEEAGNFGYGYGEWVMETAAKNQPAKAVSSPGLFGSFPWVDNEKGYCAILLTLNLRSRGRHDLYKELRAVVDSALP